MADTGWKSAGGGSTYGFGDVWSNPGNVTSSDNSRASVTSSESQQLLGYNFGFSVPAGATIDGFEIRHEGSSSSTLSGLWVYVCLDNVDPYAGASVGAGVPIFSTTEAETTVGGATDDFGGVDDNDDGFPFVKTRDWTVSDVNASSFAVGFGFYMESGTSTVLIDHIQAKVYYTLTGGAKDIGFANSENSSYLFGVDGGTIPSTLDDITIQHGQTDSALTSTTQSITTINNMDNAFVINTNNRRMTGGETADTSTQDADEMSGGMYLLDVSTIQIDKQITGTASKFSWEVWEYGGATSGANEFKVRGRTQHTMTAETDTITISGIINIDNCIPFITGILSSSAGDDADSSTAVAWMSGSDTLNIKRGSGTNHTVKVYVTVVEFTGSNWNVYHGRNTSIADSGTITLVDASNGTTSGGGDVSDWTTAAIFHQYNANNLNGVDDSISDTSAVYEPGSLTTQVDWVFNANHVDSGTGASHMVHVLKHSEMNVTRYTSTQNTQGTMAVDITSAAISDLTKTSAQVSRSSSGNGTAYGRGWVNIELTSTTNADMWCQRSGNTCSSKIQIIEFIPSIGGSSKLIGYIVNQSSTVSLIDNRARELVSNNSETLIHNGVTARVRDVAVINNESSSYIFNSVKFRDVVFLIDEIDTFTADSSRGRNLISFISENENILFDSGRGRNIGYSNDNIETHSFVVGLDRLVVFANNLVTTESVNIVKQSDIAVLFAETEYETYNTSRTCEVMVALDSILSHTINITKESLLSLVFTVGELTTHTIDSARDRDVFCALSQSHTPSVDTARARDIAYANAEQTVNTFNAFKERTVTMLSEISEVIGVDAARSRGISHTVGETTSYSIDNIRNRDVNWVLNEVYQLDMDTVRTLNSGYGYDLVQTVLIDTVRERACAFINDNAEAIASGVIANKTCSFRLDETSTITISVDKPEAARALFFTITVSGDYGISQTFTSSTNSVMDIATSLSNLIETDLVIALRIDVDVVSNSVIDINLKTDSTIESDVYVNKPQ